MLRARRAVRLGLIKSRRAMTTSLWRRPKFGSVSAYGEAVLEKSEHVKNSIGNGLMRIKVQSRESTVGEPRYAPQVERNDSFCSTRCATRRFEFARRSAYCTHSFSPVNKLLSFAKYCEPFGPHFTYYLGNWRKSKSL